MCRVYYQVCLRGLEHPILWQDSRCSIPRSSASRNRQTPREGAQEGPAIALTGLPRGALKWPQVAPGRPQDGPERTLREPACRQEGDLRSERGGLVGAAQKPRERP